MPIEILMPALSPTMEEGTLSKWLVKEGDTVSSGDLLAEIETDKATMEFEAVDEGVIGKIMIAEGSERVKVNTVIAVLLEDGEEAGDISPSPAPASTTAAPEAATPTPAALTSVLPTRASPPCMPPRRLPPLCLHTPMGLHPALHMRLPIFTMACRSTLLMFKN